MLEKLRHWKAGLKGVFTDSKEGILGGNDPRLLLTGNGQKGIYGETLFRDVLFQGGLPLHNVGVIHFTHSTTLKEQVTKRTPVQIAVENFAEETKKRGFTPDIGIHLFAEGEFETVNRTVQSLIEIKKAYPNIPHLIINLPPLKDTHKLVEKDRKEWSPQALAEKLDMLYLELNPTLAKEQEYTFLTGIAHFLSKKSSIALLQELQKQSRFIGVGMNSQEFFITNSPHVQGSDFERLDYATTNAVGVALSEEGRISTYRRKEYAASEEDAFPRDIIILQTPSVRAPATSPEELVLGLLPTDYPDPKQAHFATHTDKRLLIKDKVLGYDFSTGTATAIVLYPAAA